MQLHIDNFILRPYHETDIPTLINNGNNIKIWRNLSSSFPHPYTEEDAKQWIALCKKENPQLTFMIEIVGECAGSIGFIAKKGVHTHTLEMGYWLGEKYWNKGIMTKIAKRMVEYAFDNFDIVRLEARAFGYNKGSQRVLEKVGFEPEGILRQAIFKDNQFTDLHLYSIIRV